MPKATVVITADNQLKKGIDPAKKTLLELQNSVDNLNKKISKSLTVAGMATAAVAAFKMVKKAVDDLIGAYSEAEKVSKRLEAVWNNVGTATGRTAKEMDDYAESLEKVTYFSSESIKEAGLLLAATESLTEEGFDRALNASMDLASALGQDVTSAAQTLAGALEAPDEAFRRLKSIGIAFTEDEKKQIKELIEANDLYEAQAIILGKVEERYKDVAKAINNTPAGTLDNIKDTLEDIRESLGGALLDTISPALQNIYEWLQKLSDWIKSASDFSKVFNSLQRGESIANYSALLLEQTRDYYKELVANPPNNEIKAHLDKYLAFIDTLDAELQRRAQLATNISNNVTPIVIGGESGGSTSAESSLASLLSKYGSQSESYQIRQLNESIALAESIRDSLESASTSEKVQMLKDAGISASPTQTLGWLNQIIDSMNSKLDGLTALPEILDNPTLTDLDSILESYGKNSVSYQKEVLKAEYNRIAEAYEYASDEQKVYLKEILAENEKQREALEELPEVLQKSFLDKFSANLASLFEKAGLGNSTQASAAAGGVISSFTSSMGEAGEVVSTLAQNMLTMGPALGAIVTALKYVFEGIAETLGDTLNEFVKYGIEPLRELGRVIGDLLKPLLEAVMPLVKDSAESLMSVFHGIATALMPIINLIVNIVTPIFDQLANTLKFIEPIVEAIALVLASVNGVLSYVGQAIMHFVAVFLNWMAGLNLFGWKPFEGLAIKDPGSPGNFGEYMDNIYTGVQESFSQTYAGNTNADQQAIASASYRGATNVTINIYAEGPFVGDGGMRQFAQMIREEFDALDYYGVSA